jgi:hypothetical protein
MPLEIRVWLYRAVSAKQLVLGPTSGCPVTMHRGLECVKMGLNLDSDSVPVVVIELATCRVSLTTLISHPQIFQSAVLSFSL